MIAERIKICGVSSSETGTILIKKLPPQIYYA